MPDLPYHPARDLELRATYDTYRETGVPLLKENGTGSWYGSVEGTGLTRAAGDDDPGSYLVASWMSHLTGSDSPYPGLRWAMALLCALPLLILPLTVARVFRRARAGYAMLLLPPVTWLVNKGTVLVGTEYGLSDQVAVTRVYALYGMAASMLFLNLVLLTYVATRRLGLRALVALSVLFVVLASASNLLRSLSGVGVALAVGVLWWLNWSRGRLRLVVAAGAGLVAVAGAMVLPGLFMDRVDDARNPLLSEAAESLPSAHGTWHPLYLGLSYPQPITGAPSEFGITWSDEFGWAKAREVDPDVLVASAEYDAIMKDLYLDQVREKPVAAMRLYLAKGLYVLKHFAAMIVLVVIGYLIAWQRPGPHRRLMGAATAIALPTLLFGLVPTVLVMPMLYYYSELVAGLGLLSAVALGGLVWGFTTLPAFVRSSERRRLASRDPAIVTAGERALSVVVPSRNGAEVLPETLATLAGELSANDEVIVVENGSTDDTAAVLQEISESWAHPCSLVVTSSEPGLGNALRTGVSASAGRRLLLTADDLPFGLTDLVAFRELPPDVVVAIGSKAHPGSRVARSRTRTLQSRVFRWLRSAMLHSSVGDSQGTIWVDGPWARSFASVSRETGLMWTVELVLAAEQQGHAVWEAPVELRPSHDASTSRFRFRDAWIGVREIWQLALRKDDYSAESYPTIGAVLSGRGT
ncbi:glycosyltransferase [Nocardioides sp. YIM 152315]|uniref:glycosyltransferase n=1 Tax=Nocardioides sp. YIM 152315 TaxID=3031760 RepID=UPI0023DBE983|nr:glycosyltransferase [Nocardioides sp. YIM 152315]MDF1605214.1 glycosyltransferase [Nocardioides sp. YIM 152315]